MPLTGGNANISSKKQASLTLSRSFAGQYQLSKNSIAELICKFFLNLAAISAELGQHIIKRIGDAAEMGEATTLTTIAKEIMIYSDSCLPLSIRIVQGTADF
ncbi:MAG: hypothetical protein PVG69_10015 [Desulfobacterales bacterium]|jgi:hypothetical protein